MRYSSVFVNSNGNLTFGAPDTRYLGSAAAMLSGRRASPLWTDLNPSAGGVVTFDQTDDSFSIVWRDVPAYPADGANSFTVTLHRKRGLLGWLFGDAEVGSAFSVSYGDVSALTGVAGFSCGGRETSGFEDESDLSALGRYVVAFGRTAVFEEFAFGPEGTDVFDLAGATRTFLGTSRLRDWFDLLSPNDDLASATPLLLPATTSSLYTNLEPGDVDYYRLHVAAGELLSIEVVRGQLDSLIGVFDADTGDLLFVDDDGGNGLLSRALLQVDQDANLAIAVSTYGDDDFSGSELGAGRYVLHVNRYRGEVLPLTDEDSVELDLGGVSLPFEGARYGSLFVNANGNLTFGDADGSGFATPEALVAGPPGSRRCGAISTRPTGW